VTREIKTGRIRVAIALTLSSLSIATASAQPPDQSTEQVRPAPRWPDGRISFTGPAGEIGNWDGRPTSTLANNSGRLSDSRVNLPTNLSLEDVPFQPWAREAYEYRQATFTKDDPHTRCKPSGGARMFHTPYGFEILDLPDAGQIIFVSVGAPHSWRVVYMDGRSHPADPDPTWFGHSIGHWEDDTLVIDTIAFNDRFWISRGGFPHTIQLHTIERLSRPDFNTLLYEITIDDPGAYTDTWSGGFIIPWIPDNEPFDYLCQENNLDAARMIGPQD